MKILHISDIHGRVENFSLVEKHLHSCQLVAISGDLTHMGDQLALSKILQYLPLEKTVAVLGNCDYPSSLKTLQSAGISIDGEIKTFAGYQICGYGGSLPTPIDTPNMLSEQEFGQVLGSFASPNILITHQPAFGTKADLSPDQKHTGSKSIWRYIESVQPKLALCGHMHEAQSISKIGKTTVVNSGALALGNFAIIHLSENELEVELR